ncbi:MAG: Zn-ribbon domain-containing OB-fold protein [Acidilobus sp.]
MSMDLSIPKFWRLKYSIYKFQAAKCRSCGRVHYPPKKACPYCGSRDLEPVQLPKRGKLLSHTVVYAIPEGSRQYSPIYVGLVDLGPTKVVTELTDVADPSQLKKGMEVEAVLRRTRVDREAGLIYYALKFRPAMGVPDV